MLGFQTKKHCVLYEAFVRMEMGVDNRSTEDCENVFYKKMGGRAEKTYSSEYFQVLILPGKKFASFTIFTM